jgi:hypothetical protein
MIARSVLTAALIAVGTLSSGCDSATPDPTPDPTPTGYAVRVARPLPDTVLYVSGESTTFDLAAHFTDENGRPLQFYVGTVEGSPSTVITTVSGSVLTLRTREIGTSEVIVTARNEDGQTAADTLRTRVTAYVLEDEAPPSGRWDGLLSTPLADLPEGRIGFGETVESFGGGRYGYTRCYGFDGEGDTWMAAVCLGPSWYTGPLPPGQYEGSLTFRTADGAPVYSARVGAVLTLGDVAGQRVARVTATVDGQSFQLIGTL